MKKSGFIAKLSDGRLVIVYSNQPLKEKGKIVLNLVDDHYNPLLKDRKPLTLIQDIETYRKTITDSKIIGYTD